MIGRINSTLGVAFTAWKTWSGLTRLRVSLGLIQTNLHIPRSLKRKIIATLKD